MDFQRLKSKLNKSFISSHILLSNVKLLDNDTVNSVVFNDYKYFPFYYHLGCESQAEKIFQIGPKLGLIGAAFLQGCKSAKSWSILDEKNILKNFVFSNIRKYFKGEISWNFNGKCDLALLTDEYDYETHNMYLNLLWDNLKSEGLLLVDCLNINECIKNSVEDFCGIMNCDVYVFDTRYGLGLIKKR